MLVIKVLLFICLWTQTSAYNILCLLPYPGKSHYLVFEPLLQELQTRGHNLTVVSFFPTATPQKNRRDVDLRSLASLNVEIVDLKDFDYSFFWLEKYFEHIPIITGLAKSQLQLCKRIMDSKIFEEFLAAEGDYDLILVEHFNSDCMLGIVHNYGLPSIGLMSTSMLPWTPQRLGAPANPAYVPEMMVPFTAEMTFFERVQNTICHYFYLWWFEMVIRWEEQRVLEKKLGRLPKLENVGKNTSVVLMNTYHVWNGVRSFPPSLVEVGGIHLHNKPLRPLRPELEKWVSDAKDGFIVLSFGSLIRGSTLPEKRLRAILKVFARLPQRIVWKWETDMIDAPNNVYIMKWLPQYDLLRHNNCVAFISHAGLLGLTEAVSAGVPILAVPILGDQYGNTAHAEKAGIARVVRLQNLDEETLYDSLQRVLTSEMRERAKFVSEMWRDRLKGPMETAVFHIERTARHKGVEMSSHARWMTAWELALMDVIVFIAGGLVAVYLIVRYTFRNWHKKEKQC